MRTVRGGVGVAQGGLGVVAAAAQGDADAGADGGHQAVRGLVRLGQRLQHALAERAGVAGALGLLADHDELVAARPGQRVARAQQRGDTARGDAQHLVADGVAGLLVDAREAVEVAGRTATRGAPGVARASAWPSRSISRLRFGRPVRRSCNAWRRIASSSCARPMAAASTFAMLCMKARSSLVNGRSVVRAPREDAEHAAAQPDRARPARPQRPRGCRRLPSSPAPSRRRPATRRRPRCTPGRHSSPMLAPSAARRPSSATTDCCAARDASASRAVDSATATSITCANRCSW